MPPVRPTGRRPPPGTGGGGILPQYLAISPFFILFAVFGAYPVVYSLFLALQRWDGIGPMKFVGLDNFAFLLTDAEFWNSIGNTLAHLGDVDGPDDGARAADRARPELVDPVQGAATGSPTSCPNVTSIVAMSIVFGSIFSAEFGILNAILRPRSASIRVGVADRSVGHPGAPSRS